MIKEVNYDNIQQCIDDNKYVILKFFATWCGPCQRLNSVVHDVSNNYKDVTVLEIDIDKYESLARVWNIKSVPTLIFIKQGNTVNTICGYQSKDELEGYIKKIFIDN